MTPIEQIGKLKTDFIDRIDNVFNQDDEIFSIEFESEENDLDIEPAYLTRDGVLTLLDEFSNEIDEKLEAMSIEVVAIILTLIQNKKYTVYERI